MSNGTSFHENNVSRCDSFEQLKNIITFYLMGVVAMTISSIGILGNLVCLFVLARPSMRGNNTYKYLMALALSDSLVLVATILTAMKDTKLDKTTSIPASFTSYLFVIGHSVSIMFQVCSVWLTVAFTGDRYFMVCHPFQAQRLCLKRHVTICVILLIYLAATLYNIPRFFEFEIHTLEIEGAPSGHPYYIQWSTRSGFGKSIFFLQVYHLWSWFLLVALIPLGSISYMNVYLIKEIQQSKERQRSFARRHEQHRTTLHAVALAFASLRLRGQDTNIMLVGIIAIFLTCQIPVTICHIIYAFVDHKAEDCFCLGCFTFNEVANILIIFNSAINIIPYYFFGRKFRNEFRLMCTEWLSCNPMFIFHKATPLTTSTVTVKHRRKFSLGCADAFFTSEERLPSGPDRLVHNHQHNLLSQPPRQRPSI